MRAISQPPPTSNRVFLGGTCNESNWRVDLIKLLNENIIDFFDPVVENWNELAKKRELNERKNCDWVLYCITPKMIGTYSIAEVVDDSNKRPHKTIFIPLNADGELKFDMPQWKSLQAVGDLVQRNGGKVCYTFQGVIQHILRT